MNRCRSLAVALCLPLSLLSSPSYSQDKNEWKVLIGPGKELDAWKSPTGDWLIAGDAGLDPKEARRLEAKPGKGVIVQPDRKLGKGRNLLSKESFGDVEIHVEFMIPKGSNSGVKFHGHYEIAIQDSYNIPLEKLKGSDCGGIYPRAESRPKYHHIDIGIPPAINACKAPGEWQKLEAIFIAPRFNDKGEKIVNARLVKVVLNDQLIHDNVELKHPTSADWKKKEFPTGPLYLQADHGGVAFRDVRVRAVSK